MWGVASCKEASVKDEKKDLSELHKISDAAQEQDMVSVGE